MAAPAKLVAVKFRTWISEIALGALALGAFFSCSPPAPQNALPLDRTVSALNVYAANQDSAWLAQNPDSSGWRLRWRLPATTTGIERIYVFSVPDSLTPAQVSKLGNGSQPLDLSNFPGIPPSPTPVALSDSDTSWQIPASFLDGRQGKKMRTDKHYWFEVWVQYGSGPVAPAPTHDLFFGDHIPPLIPTILDSEGQTYAVLRFARPHDQTNDFDTLLNGPLRTVKALWWPGGATDSAGHVSSVQVPADSLINLSVDSFRLVLSPLKYWTQYSYALQVVDTSGNPSSSDIPFQITTLSQYPPSAPNGLTPIPVRTDSVAFSWSASADTFQSDSASRTAFPNYHIEKYVVRLNGARVDSVYWSPLDDSVAPLFGLGHNTPFGRFQWNGQSGQNWTWYWRSFRPGKSYLVELIVYDASGNVASTIPSIAVPVPPVAGVACDSGWVPVLGYGVPGSGLSNFCIEEHEHLSGSRIATRVAWAQAVQTCSQAGAELCSEAQWVHACETFPQTSDTATYGAVDVGNGMDTLPWLTAHCQLGTGDSVAMLDPTNTDPLCVSGWGVYDMPGRVSEWTRDVYLTLPDTATQLEPGTLAYLGNSDLTGQSDLGTLHGGSSLILDQPSLILASAQCRERNYPAFSAVDTLKDSLGNVVSTPRVPNPQGISSAWGFRCCKLAP